MSNTTTLKARYQQKQNLVAVNEKSRRMNESDRLNEEIDQRLMKTVIDSIKNLKQIDFGTMEILKQARDAAVLDVSRAASGTQKNGLMNRIAGMFREKNSPLFDALAFGSAISSFFPQLTDYLEAVGSESGEPVDDQSSIGQIMQSDEMKNAVRNIISKGLRPSGTLARLGAGWAKKYLKGSIDDLTDQIMAAPIGELKQTAASVKRASTNVNQAAQAAQQRAQQGPAQQSGGKAEQVMSKIQDRLGDLDDEKKQLVSAVIKHLVDADLLK